VGRARDASLLEGAWRTSQEWHGTAVRSLCFAAACPRSLLMLHTSSFRRATAGRCPPTPAAVRAAALAKSVRCACACVARECEKCVRYSAVVKSARGKIWDAHDGGRRGIPVADSMRGRGARSPAGLMSVCCDAVLSSRSNTACLPAYPLMNKRKRVVGGASCM